MWQVLTILAEAVSEEAGTVRTEVVRPPRHTADHVTSDHSLLTPQPLPKLASSSSLPSVEGGADAAALDSSWVSSCAMRLRDSAACQSVLSAVDQGAECCAVDAGTARVLATAVVLSIAAKLVIVACRSEALCCCALLLLLHTLYHAGMQAQRPVRSLVKLLQQYYVRLSNESHSTEHITCAV